MNTPASEAADTPQRILDVAEHLVQTRGFNGFSYADIAAAVGLTKATLHYHFATKAELGRRLIERYAAAFAGALQRIDSAAPGAAARLRAYVKLYADVLAEDRMCLCGMAAAEYGTLPVPMQKALQLFFAANEVWLTRLLDQGQNEGYLCLRAPAREEAAMMMSALEGAMLVARAMGDPNRFERAAASLLAQLEQSVASSPAARPPRRGKIARARPPKQRHARTLRRS
jgi:TetR/AcrR family transcriptional regulator, transcriptional repressor for nem operon